MAICQCGHQETEHKLRHACEEQIVYPSEEYPCGCERFVATPSDECSNCGHKRGRHVVLVRCQPATGELCSCIKRIGHP